MIRTKEGMKKIRIWIPVQKTGIQLCYCTMTQRNIEKRFN